MSGMENVVGVDTGAAATSACFKGLHHETAILETFGVPTAKPYPACARFKFGNGRVHQGRFVAKVPVELAGGHGKFTTFSMDAAIPALLRKGAPESLGCQ